MSDYAAQQALLLPAPHPIRPLTKGVISNLASNLIPEPSATTLRGYDVRPEGLRRMNGFVEDTLVFPDANLKNLDPIILGPFREGTVRPRGDNLYNTYLFTDSYVFRLNGTSLSYAGGKNDLASLDPELIDKPGGTADFDFRLTVGSGKTVPTGLLSTDILAITLDGETRFFSIVSITSGLDGHIDFIANNLVAGIVKLPDTWLSTTLDACVVLHAFVDGYDFTYSQDTLYVSSSALRGVLAIAQDNSTSYLDGPDIDIVGARAICWHDDRLFSMNIFEDSEYVISRLRWSDRDLPTEVGAASFLNLGETTTGGLRLLPMGSLLVAYCGDMLHIGRFTNYTDKPWQFEPVETGRVGLVGPDAVCGYVDGHYWVGQDDIYYLSPSGGLQKIGTPVFQTNILLPRSGAKVQLSKTRVVADPERQRILFLFFYGASEMASVWAYNYTTEAWSELPLNHRFSGASYIGKSISYPYDDQSWTFDSPTAETTRYMDIKDNLHEFTLYGFWPTQIFRTAPDEATSEIDGGAGVSVHYESGDLEFDMPTKKKTLVTFTLKLLSPLRPFDGTPLLFNVDFSLDRGQTWIPAPNLLIPEGYDEGRTSRRISGTMIRWRLRSTSTVYSYIITEVTPTLVVKGNEAVFVF